MSPLNRYLMLIILSVLANYATASNSSPSQAAPSNQQASQEVQLKQSNVGSYLGIRVDILSKELAAQLPEDVLVGQGVMVSGFMENSPAPKQGIKLYDIILNYNQQALMHPKIFFQLIKNGRPRQKLKLTISRKGKILTIPVTMGSENYPLNENQLDYQYNLQVLGYDGVKIKQLSKHYFEATIRYLAPDGVVRRRSFSGPYNLIQRDIFRATDLSNIAKQQLLQAISKRKSDEEGWFGDMMPFTDGFF